jgi:NhaP-type Na+/H+ or K+/H+ antiporter
MRIVLAIGLFAIGVELPKAYLAEHARSLLVMVVPTMAFGWIVCGGNGLRFRPHGKYILTLCYALGLLKAVFPNLSFVACLGISACLTPTDPILSHSIIHGKFARKRVPRHIREIIAAESAVNDGMAYPFLTIAIYLITEPSDRVAFEKWFLVGWLCENH